MRSSWPHPEPAATTVTGPAATVRRIRPLLGTLVEVRITAATATAAERAVRAAFAAVASVHDRMSFHEAGSDVSRLNRRGAHEAVSVHASTYSVLRRALRLHAATGGIFDIAIAPALVRGGWLPRAAPLPASGGTTADIRLLSGHRVRFRRPLLIDLGGIAKGYAVDRAIAALKRHGATGGVVNAGGDLRVFGAQSEVVHVRLPGSPGTLAPLLVLRDRAVATSAHYFAQREIDGRLVAPICDPRHHRLAAEARSVSVVARECWLADALCKVVWLAGAEAQPWLRRFRASARVLAATGDYTGKREDHSHAA